MNHEDYTRELTHLIGSRFLDESAAADLGPETPLLEWGILTSMNTAVLLTHLREDYGIAVPPQDITGRNLVDIDHLAALLVRLDDETAGVLR